MKRTVVVRKIGIVIGLILVLTVAGLAYVWFSGGSGEPSSEVTAPPVTTRALAQPEGDPGSPTEQDAQGQDPDAVTMPTTGPTTIVATTVSGGATTTIVEDPEPASEVVYRIDKAASSVRFEIGEILNGSPKRVVGVTSEVAGEVLIDFGDPAASRLGAIVINVRTLETDSSFRNRAMRGPILGSADDENEFATFEPSTVEGLPDRIAVGDRISLAITGNLTLSGVTRAVVFETEVMVAAADRIEVSGSATVLRSEFGLTIPDVPSVSGVEDDVLLLVDLVAVAV